MNAFVRFILGLSALLVITFMTMAFGVGGFFFTLGLYAVIIFAIGK